LRDWIKEKRVQKPAQRRRVRHVKEKVDNVVQKNPDRSSQVDE